MIEWLVYFLWPMFAGCASAVVFKAVAAVVERRLAARRALPPINWLPVCRTRCNSCDVAVPIVSGEGPDAETARVRMLAAAEVAHFEETGCRGSVRTLTEAEQKEATPLRGSYAPSEIGRRRARRLGVA